MCFLMVVPLTNVVYFVDINGDWNDRLLETRQGASSYSSSDSRGSMRVLAFTVWRESDRYHFGRIS